MKKSQAAILSSVSNQNKIFVVDKEIVQYWGDWCNDNAFCGCLSSKLCKIFFHCWWIFQIILYLVLCKVFDAISSNIDEVLSINPSDNVFVFGNFNVHHKDWITYSIVELQELANSVKISNDLTQMVNFPTRNPDRYSYGSVRLDLVFRLPTLLFVLQWVSLHWEILIRLLSQFPLTFI